MELKDKLQLSQVFKFGASEMWKRVGFFIILMLIVFFIPLIFNLFAGFLAEGDLQILGLVFYFFGFVISFVMNVGLIRIGVLCARGEVEPEYDDLFRPWRKVFSFFVANFLYGLLVAVGLILLIIPGVYWLVKYSLFPYFIVDKDAGIFDSFTLSGQATEGNKWRLLFLYLLVGLLNIVGLLCFGVGVLFTAPITLIAVAYAYVKLSTKPHTAEVTE